MMDDAGRANSALNRRMLRGTGGCLRTFDPRPDGRPTRGLPHDAQLRPEPMRAAIAQAFANAAPRPAR